MTALEKRLHAVDSIIHWWEENRPACKLVLPARGDETLEMYVAAWRAGDRGLDWAEEHIAEPVQVAKAILWARLNWQAMEARLPLQVVGRASIRDGRPAQYLAIQSLGHLERSINGWMAGELKTRLATAYINAPLRQWREAIDDEAVHPTCDQEDRSEESGSNEEKPKAKRKKKSTTGLKTRGRKAPAKSGAK